MFAGPPPAEAAVRRRRAVTAQQANGGDSAAPPQAPRFDSGQPNQKYNNQNNQETKLNNNNSNNNGPRHHQNDSNQQGGSRRGRRNRRGRQRTRPAAGGGSSGEHQVMSGPPPVDRRRTANEGWFDASRDGGFIRRAVNSYLADAATHTFDHIVRQYGLFAAATSSSRPRDATTAAASWSPKSRTINGDDPTLALRRARFQLADRELSRAQTQLETGRPAKGGPELTRRAIDLIAPIGYGQRALIVAPARAGKTMLLHAITEGVAINHPEATLLVLLVDERPEEVSEMISWGVGEVVASSFDSPPRATSTSPRWCSSAPAASSSRARTS